MAIRSGRVTVGDTPVRIDTWAVTVARVAIKNLGPATIDVGPATVAAGANWPVDYGESFSPELGPADLGLYAVAPSGQTADVAYFALDT